MEETFRERVREKVTSIPNKEIMITFPRPVFKRFSHWAFVNANDCFWLAIDKLLNHYEQHQLGDTVQMLMDRDEVLMRELVVLKAASQEKTERKHFGKKGEKSAK